MRRPSVRYTRCVVAGALSGVLLTVSAARGDVVGIAGQPPHVDAKVIELRGAQLQFQLAGVVASRPIEQVEYLQIMGWQLFNLAEKQHRDRHFREAANSYEAVLKEQGDPTAAARNARSQVSDKLDRVLLTRCRLVRAYDAQGRFDRAVEVHLAILDSPDGGVAYAQPLRPAKLPAPDSDALATARKRIEEAARRHASDPIGEALTRWLAALPKVPGVQPVASAPAGVTDSSAQRLSPGLREIKQLVESGRHAEALQRVRPLQNESSGFVRAELYYWQGRALLARSESESGEAAETDARRAGAAFMRVPIHFPGHPRAPECLFLAGRVCERSGLVAEAIGLWTELVANYPESGPWAAQARDAAAGSTASAPAR